jgi:RecA/RadA recombinase
LFVSVSMCVPVCVSVCACACVCVSCLFMCQSIVWAHNLRLSIGHTDQLVRPVLSVPWRGYADSQRKQRRKKSKGALDVAISQIESMYGPGSLMKLGDEKACISQRWTPQDVIPTGSFRLDHALGIGGLPRGRVIEMYGPESCGKTTLALHAVAEAQKAGGTACFIDVEHALDTDYAANLGVDMTELYIAQPQSGEQALEIMDTLIRSGSMDLIVLDSVAALVPRAELEGEMGDVHVGLQARLMSQALRKLTASLATGPRNSGGSGPGGAEEIDEETGEVVREHPPALIFINQLRQKIGGALPVDATTACH